MAAHGAAGINFQNTAWLHTDTFYRDASGNFQVYPRAYGIRAFDVGSHGSVKPVTIGNTNNLNLTAYAIGDTTNLCVTIINKEHGAGARDATVTVLANGFDATNAAAMFLTAPNGDVGATNGGLGGATITNDTPWRGKWTVLNPATNGQCVVTVPAPAAAVVKISARL